MRGVPANLYGSTIAQLLGNALLRPLVKVMGLDPEKTYDDQNDLKKATLREYRVYGRSRSRWVPYCGNHAGKLVALLAILVLANVVWALCVHRAVRDRRQNGIGAILQ